MRNVVYVLGLTVLLQACQVRPQPPAPVTTTTLLPLAESVIDAFYSFDAVRLDAALRDAAASKESLLYYQGWAEGGNYEIVERGRCVVKARNVVSCPITVKDDPMLALGVDFFVTDTFEITFAEGSVVAVETSSNDLPIYYEARDWVEREMPELIAQPCQGFFAGGPTPGECAAAMAEGYRRFAASDDFPEQ